MEKAPKVHPKDRLIFAGHGQFQLILYLQLIQFGVPIKQKCVTGTFRNKSLNAIVIRGKRHLIVCIK